MKHTQNIFSFIKRDWERASKSILGLILQEERIHMLIGKREEYDLLWKDKLPPLQLLCKDVNASYIRHQSYSTTEPRKKKLEPAKNTRTTE